MVGNDSLLGKPAKEEEILKNWREMAPHFNSTYCYLIPLPLHSNQMPCPICLPLGIVTNVFFSTVSTNLLCPWSTHAHLLKIFFHISWWNQFKWTIREGLWICSEINVVHGRKVNRKKWVIGLTWLAWEQNCTLNFGHWWANERENIDARQQKKRCIVLPAADITLLPFGITLAIFKA